MKKLLLHTCCGPCFLGVWEALEKENLVVTNYFYNPNIYPKREYKKRLEGLEKAAVGRSQGVIEGEYRPRDHEVAVSGVENKFPERCIHCYRLRIFEVARYARENEFDAFSTTLLVSPYQNHELLKQIGEEAAKELGIKFYYSDWRPFFRSGQQEAKIIPIYRQKYCGCKYSLEEAKIK